MKIIALGDSHLGFSQGYKIDKDSGLNDRATDILRAFGSSINIIIEQKPDVIIHAGDLFDSSRPPAWVVASAIDGFSRIQNALPNTPIYVIGGTHEWLKSAGTWHSFEVLQRALPGVKFVYGEPELITTVQGYTIMAFPHLPPARLYEATETAPPANFMTAHAPIAGTLGAISGSEQAILSPCVTSKYDMIFLGHYHNLVSVAPNAIHMGSSECLKIDQISPKVVVVYDTDTREITPHVIPTRRYSIIDIDATDKTAPDLLSAILSASQGIEGTVCHLRVSNIEPAVRDALDMALIRKTYSVAFSYHPKFFTAQEGTDEGISTVTIGSLEEEYAARCRKNNRSAEIIQVGLEYLGG